ncbi:xylulokinase [Formosa algae]|uniref:Xylulokinase n=1 Tax=Formosa algae TaxID=225843 RepID=A0A9X0YKS1_9FLAO|nr:FGGY family carbohydrate kinase [Formosa algae]MBP1838718.1 xylulokinase [Formosa algae]MDQ0335218.1 xylulokinase [Formosa algae]OEI81652.1 carbohydrate kinase [Formosa algae]
MYHLGIDLGSSSVKVALVDAKSGKKIVSLHEPPNEMEIIAVNPDWAEQDPNIWWTHVCKAIKRVTSEAQVNLSEIKNIGISYQMHGLVIVDKKGQPLRNSIIWCDSRAVEIGRTALQDLGKDLCGTHMLNAPGNFTASKLKWVIDNEPEIYKNTYKFMLPGDFIAYKLTGKMVTTKNGLSEGVLWNYSEDDVATDLLKYYGIDKDLVPEIVENFTNQGEVNTQAASETGLSEGVQVTYRSGDQPNNALSLNIFNPGEVAATGGTSGVVYAVSNNLKPQEISKVNHFAHVNYTATKPVIGTLLNINGAGIQYRWLRNNCGNDSYEVMNDKASKVDVGSNGVVIIPFGNGAERMLENKNIGTHILNLNLNQHNNAHLYRAALEGIAFSFVYGVEILRKDIGEIKVIRAGNDNLFRSEIFSNTVATLINHDIEIYNTTGAVGAARAAGLTDGDFKTFGENITKNDHVMTYRPLQDKAPFEAAYKQWKTELEMILKHK